MHSLPSPRHSGRSALQRTRERRSRDRAGSRPDAETTRGGLKQSRPPDRTPLARAISAGERWLRGDTPMWAPRDARTTLRTRGAAGPPSQLSEAAGTVVLVKATVVLGAVEPQPASSGGRYELGDVVEALTAYFVAGEVAVDGDAAEVTRIVRWVVPQLGVGCVGEREGGHCLAIAASDVHLAAVDEWLDRLGREGTNPLIGDALPDQPVVGLAQECDDAVEVVARSLADLESDALGGRGH